MSLSSPNTSDGPTSRTFPSLSEELINNHRKDDINPDNCIYISPSDINNHLDPGSFNILSLNSRSLSSLINDLQNLLADSPDRFAVVALQEVWSAKRHFSIPGYQSLASRTRDQDKMVNTHCGGGTGLFIAKGIPSEILIEQSVFIPGVYESIWAKIKPKSGAKSVIVASIYRPNTPPRANITLAIKTHLNIIDSIRKDKSLKSCRIIITSDFNLDLLDYAKNDKVTDYVDSQFSRGLVPLITKSAHFTDSSAKVIDHIFTSEPPNKYKSGIIEAKISDHLPTFFSDPSIFSDPVILPEPFRKINKSSTKSFVNLLSSAKFSDSEDPKTAFDSFFNLITSAAELSFPLEQPTNFAKKKRYTPWMTPGLLISSATKHKLYSKKIRSKSVQDATNFANYNRIFNSLKKKAKKAHYLKAFSDSINDLKTTWKLINEVSGRKKGNNDPLPSYFINPSDPSLKISSKTEIANHFNSFFSSIGPKLAADLNTSHLPRNNFEKYMGSKPDCKFKFQQISVHQMLQIVKGLKNKKSAGNDLMSNNLLKLAIPSIAAQLTRLTNLSLTSGFVPSQITVARVLPLYKDGNKREFNNYRPIAIISTIGKVVEKVVCLQLSNYFNKNNLLHKNQFGFRTKHSVEHPLMLFSNNVMNSLRYNLFSLAVFIDLKKAFDTVNFDILLAKLSFYGVSSVEIEWFKNYLVRFQCVKVGASSFSDTVRMLCGIPQGTCLGPLLFLIFINDLPLATLFISLLFADDTTFQLEGPNLSNLITLANVELKKAEEWFSSNLLTLNSKKTKLMIFSPNTYFPPPSSLPKLKIGETIIERVGNGRKETSVRFLGLLVDENMSFTFHIAKLKIKLGQALFHLASCKETTPLRIKKAIYFSLFESQLRFSSIIYGSASNNELEKIFKQQKRAIRLISGASYSDHTDPLFNRNKILKLNDLINLERSIHVHKYTHGKLPIAFYTNYLEQVDSESMSRRGDPLCYKLPRVPKNLSRSPVVQIVKAWNSLPHSIKIISEPTLFKQAIVDVYVSGYNDICSKKNCYSCITSKFNND